MKVGDLVNTKCAIGHRHKKYGLIIKGPENNRALVLFGPRLLGRKPLRKWIKLKDLNLASPLSTIVEACR